MAATTRANVIVGPAKITRNSLAVHSQGNIVVREVNPLFDIPVDAYGKIDSRMIDSLVNVSFTPDGRWTSNIRSLLFPHLNPTIGADIFSNSDVPLYIDDVNENRHTIIASALTKMPQLILRPDATMIGAAEFAGVRGTGADWNDPDKLYTMASTGGTLTDTAFAIADIKTQIYSLVWTGITGFTTAVYSVDGWTVDWEVDVAPIKIDEVGTVKMVLTSVRAMIKGRPLGVTYANITAAMKNQGTGGRRGRSLAAASADAILTGEDGSTIITIKNANLHEGGFNFGSSIVRDGELAWISTRPFATGAPAAIATLA